MDGQGGNEEEPTNFEFEVGVDIEVADVPSPCILISGVSFFSLISTLTLNLISPCGILIESVSNVVDLPGL